jgi:hypothetical protein
MRFVHGEAKAICGAASPSIGKLPISFCTYGAVQIVGRPCVLTDFVGAYGHTPLQARKDLPCFATREDRTVCILRR